VAHRPIWPCAKRTELKTIVHQQFYGTHVGTFGGNSNLHISKIMNFIFSQNTPPSHLPKSCHTDQLGHVQNTPNSKNWCTKNLKVLIWGHLEDIPTFTSQKPWISFFHKTPHQAIYLSHTIQLGHVQNTPNSKYWCTKNFMVLISGTWRPFWPLHLKNHEFHFFTKHPTRQST